MDYLKQNEKNETRDFNKDLDLGQKREKFIAEKLLKETNMEAEIIYMKSEDVKNRKKYDFKYIFENNTEELFESKSEEFFTGNLYLCYKKYGKDSGIVTSDSKYYCFEFRNENIIYILKTYELKCLIADRVMLGFKEVHKQDNANNNKAILVPITFFKENDKFIRKIKY